ncbi:MAG: hypothetical protein P4L69_14785 [Desulfosporosinus sp.]|nr:hypothetical protein [Desulfosporosinus sp.]
MIKLKLSSKHAPSLRLGHHEYTRKRLFDGTLHISHSSAGKLGTFNNHVWVTGLISSGLGMFGNIDRQEQNGPGILVSGVTIHVPGSDFAAILPKTQIPGIRFPVAIL